jgi:hypothetical protein
MFHVLAATAVFFPGLPAPVSSQSRLMARLHSLWVFQAALAAARRRCHRADEASFLAVACLLVPLHQAVPHLALAPRFPSSPFLT